MNGESNDSGPKGSEGGYNGTEGLRVPRFAGSYMEPKASLCNQALATTHARQLHMHEQVQMLLTYT